MRPAGRVACDPCLTPRFAQDDLGPKSAREIAARLNVAEATITRLLHTGLTKLQHPQRAGLLAPYSFGMQP